MKKDYSNDLPLPDYRYRKTKSDVVRDQLAIYLTIFLSTYLLTIAIRALLCN